ncbi:PH domain-containing protein [Nocardia alni]|uniref:PH domain-containing protein n=1 Tax=Nocardia alni TaxID=2815723 RepID=UPI001C235122|nr:PH domain-containing protein [Nocardia alni]
MIRIPRLGYLGVLLLIFCAAFPFFGWPEVLWVLFVIPAAVAMWLERTRTVVSERGLDVRSFFGSRHIDWSQVQGVSIPKRGYVRAHLSDGTEVSLPAVGYNRLRELVEASNGRIPDPFVVPEETDAAAAPEDETAEAESAETKSTETNTTTADAASGRD